MLMTQSPRPRRPKATAPVGTGGKDPVAEPKKILSTIELRERASVLAEQFYLDAKSPDVAAAARKHAGVGFGVMFDKLTLKLPPEIREDAPAQIEALDKLITKLEAVTPR